MEGGLATLFDTSTSDVMQVMQDCAGTLCSGKLKAGWSRQTGDGSVVGSGAILEFSLAGSAEYGRVVTCKTDFDRYRYMYSIVCICMLCGLQRYIYVHLLRTAIAWLTVEWCNRGTRQR